MIRKLILFGICLICVGFITSGCLDQTAGNLTELTDYGRGVFLDGSDIHSHAR